MKDRSPRILGKEFRDAPPTDHHLRSMDPVDGPGLARPKEISGIKATRPESGDKTVSKNLAHPPRKAPKRIQSERKWTILFVDDEEMVARMGNRTLTKLGYEVIVSTSAKDAIELFTDNPLLFDLVITDQTMPKMTGTVLATKLLEIRPDLPIILTTGYSEKSIQEQTHGVPIRAFVPKPIEIRSLAGIIYDVLVECQDSPAAVTAS